MSRVYDNWERLVEATLRREKDRQLCYANSRSTGSICSQSSGFSFPSPLPHARHHRSLGVIPRLMGLDPFPDSYSSRLQPAHFDNVGKDKAPLNARNALPKINVDEAGKGRGSSTSSSPWKQVVSVLGECERRLKMMGNNEASTDLKAALRKLIEALPLNRLLHSRKSSESEFNGRYQNRRVRRNYYHARENSLSVSPRRERDSGSPTTTTRDEENAVGRPSNSLVVEPKRPSVDSQGRRNESTENWIVSPVGSPKLNPGITGAEPPFNNRSLGSPVTSPGGWKSQERWDDSDLVYISYTPRASRYLSKDTSRMTRVHRKLIFDPIKEILDGNRRLPRGEVVYYNVTTPSLDKVWSEFQRIREHETVEDLFETISSVLKKDLDGDTITEWRDCQAEMSEATVFDIESLILEDLISETIGAMASRSRLSSSSSVMCRRKLVF